MFSISRRNLLRSTAVIGTGLSLGLATGCSDSDTQTQARFAVLSDPHVYDTSLGTTGTAFEDYLAHDRKMLAESTEIMEAMAAKLSAVDKLDFLLIPGDLTKDGEKVSHQKMASILATLNSKGIATYVVPGNHDINNPHAVSFSGSTTTKVASVTPAEFAEIHKNSGFSNAIYRDSNSLSYIAEPADNVWLFAIDSCKYDDNGTYPETSGEISAATLSWILSKLTEAKSKGKLVIGMMHHGIIAHFAAQPLLFAEYVLDEYTTVGAALANAGMNIVFTGHFHAQDVVKYSFSNSVMYDVETGSGVTAPCPYRIIDLDIPAKKFDIKSYEIDSTPSKTDFATYKKDFVEQGMLELYTALGPSYGLPTAYASVGAEIHVAHYKGDETFASLSAQSQGVVQAMMASADASAQQLGYAMYDFAQDGAPGDNDLIITL
ncbi:metallophosphoesterase family protein [Seleniivibrio woodruffii]|uniref:metallophosphoesterase family protein n=1 Tax=Seleniivibrio woodruffii TaxID=1078050 RepID=UPI0039E42654